MESWDEILFKRLEILEPNITLNSQGSVLCHGRFLITEWIITEYALQQNPVIQQQLLGSCICSRLKSCRFCLQALVDESNRAYWPMMVVTRWLCLNLDMMSGIIVFLTAIVVTVVFRTDAGLAGLALTSALNLTGEYAASKTLPFFFTFVSSS